MATTTTTITIVSLTTIIATMPTIDDNNNNNNNNHNNSDKKGKNMRNLIASVQDNKRVSVGNTDHTFEVRNRHCPASKLLINELC